MVFRCFLVFFLLWAFQILVFGVFGFFILALFRSWLSVDLASYFLLPYCCPERCCGY